MKYLRRLKALPRIHAGELQPILVLRMFKQLNFVKNIYLSINILLEN